MAIVTGKTTVNATGPGVVASRVLSIVGTTTSGVCVVTPAERDSEFERRSQLDFYAVCTADTVTITCEDAQLLENTDVYYMVDTDGSGSVGGSGGIIADDEALYFGTDSDVALSFISASSIFRITSAVTEMYSASAGALGAVLSFWQESASPAGSDVIGRLIFRGEDDASAKRDYAKVDAVITNVAAANPEGDLRFFAANTGTLTEMLRLAGSGGIMTVTATSQFNGTITTGVDDTGYDVKFFGATSGKYWLWDESADQMIVLGSSAQTGNAQLTGTFTVGVDDTGHDVKFFGATASAFMLWDESADELILAGAGKLTVAGVAALNGGITMGAVTTGIHLTGNVTTGILIAGTQTDAIRINGAGTNFLAFDAVEGAVTTETGAATFSHKLACTIDGVGTVYIPLAASFA